MALNSAPGKALWLVPVPEFGGVARHVADTARAGLPGYDLVVLAPTGALTDSLVDTTATVIPSDSFGVKAGFKTSLATLIQVIETEKPDVVHSHLAYADILAFASQIKLAALSKTPRGRGLKMPLFVTTEHGIAASSSTYNSHPLRAQVMKTLHRLRLTCANRKIAVSQSTAEQMHKQWGARGVEVVYNGIDQVGLLEELKAHRVEASEKGPRILSLSRLAPEKNISVLLEAFAQVQQTYPTATLEIAGAGELEQELWQQAHDLGLSSRVVFSGFMNPAEAMGRSDLLAQLSVWENLSYTLLDAKAAGLAVVATDVGGNAEILGQQGLVPATPEVSVAKVRDAILAAATADRNQNFSWVNLQEMTQNIVRVYQGRASWQA